MATLNLYRIRVNSTLDGIEEVPGTRINNVDIVTAAPPSESLEIEAGNFQIGNMSATVRGLAEDYFREANDKDQPFIAELRTDDTLPADGSNLTFWGIVPQAHYDRETQYTQFVALSPENMLKAATAIPARSEYDVQASGYTVSANGRTLNVRVALSTPVNVGDVVKMKLPGTEFRASVEGVQTYNAQGFSEIRLATRPENLVSFGSSATGGVIPDVLQGDVPYPAVMVSGADATALEAIFPPTHEFGGKRYADLNNTGWAIKAFNSAGAEIFQGPFTRVEYLTDPPFTGRGTEAYLLTHGVSYTTLEATASVEVIRVSSGEATGDSGQTVTVYGRAAWGYAPTLDTEVRDDYYDVETLISALLSVGHGNDGTGVDPVTGNPDEGRPLGIFPWLLDAVTVRDSFDLGAVSILTTFDSKPLAALRELQMAARSLIRFQPVLVGGLPRVNAEIIPRTTVSDAATATPASGVISWNEAETPRKIDAVVVKSNDSYFQPEGKLDVVGMWFETSDGRVPQNTTFGDVRPTLSEVERLYRGLPTGANVLEITLPIVPAYRGTYFGGQSVLNDNMLVRWAEYYYTWFNTVAREVNGSLFAYDPDILGKVVSVGTPQEPEGEGSRAFYASVFVTEATPALNEIRTDFKGYILPTFIPPAAAAPVAVISGARSVVDTDGSGDEVIYLSGGRSYNPNGRALDYLWEKWNGTTWVSIGTGVSVQTTLPVGSTDVRLTVTDTVAALSDTETITVTVGAAGTLPTEEEEGPEDPRGYNSEQYEIGSTGYVRIYPNVPDTVSRVIWRKSSGEPLLEIDWDAQPSPDFWYTEGPLTQANYATNANGDYLLFSVALHELHLSWIEAWIEWEDEALVPTVARFNLDADKIADFTNAALSIDSSGNVFLNAHGDGDTQTTGGVKAYTAVVSSGSPPPSEGSYVLKDSYNNPLFNQNVHSNLASGQQLYVKVELLNRDNGAVGATTYLTIGNTTVETTGEISYLVLDDMERATFATPQNGLLFFDNDGTTDGLNLRRAGAWYRVWDEGNDGADSGLDADLWDGNQFDSYIDQAVRTTDQVTFERVTLEGLSNPLRLKGLHDGTTATLVFAEFFNQAGTVRSGYFGFGSPSDNHMTIQNDKDAAIFFRTNGASTRMAINSTAMDVIPPIWARGGILNPSGTLTISDSMHVTGETTLAQALHVTTGGIHTGRTHIGLAYSAISTINNGLKIKTNIPTVNGYGMITFNLRGHHYNGTRTFGLQISYYYFNGFIRVSGSSLGGWVPEVHVLEENGLVALWINSTENYLRFTVDTHGVYAGHNDEWFKGWTIVDEAPITPVHDVIVPFVNTYEDVEVFGDTLLAGPVHADTGIYIDQNNHTLDANKGLKVMRDSGNSQGLSVWATDTYTYLESVQDEAGFHGGFFFQQREAATDGTLNAIWIDHDDRNIVFGYNNGTTVYNVGINLASDPVSALDVNGLVTIRQDVLPLTNYTSSIGSLDKQLLSLYVAELWVNTLVAQETRSTVGGSLLVTQSSELVENISAAATVIKLKHNNMVQGDIIQLQKYNPSGTPLTQIEFMLVTSGYTLVTVDGEDAYQYSVTRSIDPTGANVWVAGDSVVYTGNSGLYEGDAQPSGGFIHLFSNTSFWDPGAQLSGPTITFNERTGDTYNDVRVTTAVGRLEGYFGVSDPDTYGFGAGDVNTAYVRVIPGEIRMVEGGSTVFRVDSGGLYVDGYGNFTGTIYATAGEIGSFKIGAQRIHDLGETIEMSYQDRRFRVAPTSVASNTSNYVEMYQNGLGDWGLKGHVGVQTVFELGSTNQIAGWVFGPADLTGGSTELNSSGLIRHTGDKWRLEADGSGQLAGGNFSWDTAGNATFVGTVTASVGVIGGWTLNSSRLYKEYVTGKYIGIQASTTTGSKTFFAGGDGITGTNAPFYVQADGYLFASNANIAGTITAAAGDIGGWSIGPSYIRKTNGVDRLALDSTLNQFQILRNYSGSFVPTVVMAPNTDFTYTKVLGAVLTSTNVQAEIGASTIGSGNSLTKEYTGLTSGKVYDIQFDVQYYTSEAAGTAGSTWSHSVFLWDGTAWVMFYSGYEGDSPLYRRPDMWHVSYPHTGTPISDGLGAIYLPTGYTGIKIEHTLDVSDFDPALYSQIEFQHTWTEVFTRTEINHAGLLVSATPDQYAELGRGRSAFAGQTVHIVEGTLDLSSYAAVELGKTGVDSQNTEFRGNMKVIGSFSVNGGKSFAINHPDPAKAFQQTLWHTSIEGPTRGDTLYRYTVEVDASGSHVMDLPSYFRYLNENPMAWVQRDGDFGSAFAVFSDDMTTLTIYADAPGTYHVLVMGTRKDRAAVDTWHGAERDNEPVSPPTSRRGLLRERA